MSNDLLWLAAASPNPQLRTALLTQAAEEFEERDWTDQGTREGRTIILDIKAGILHDRWALFADCGDPVVEPDVYWRSRRWLVTDASTPRHPFIRSDTVGRAVADVATRHGLAAASAFLKDAWTHQQVLSIDDFFFHFHSLARAEAWGLPRSAALRELTSASAAQPSSIVDRARALATFDNKEGRNASSLAAIVEREFLEASERLQVARKVRYADFLRGVYAIRPVFYSLRDLAWELHFLTGEDDSGEFLERERLVDEWQADMFQLLMLPSAELVHIGVTNNMTEVAMRNHLAFWTRGRVQFNDEMQELALRAFNEGGIDVMIGRLGLAIRAALDPTQLAALQFWEETVSRYAAD